jgi:histidinol-phosphate/aromatic aminotransferase/cobyric acid decarboxylase-like protein
MRAFWSRIARELSPYVPGEQPRIANLVKLNTNESPFGPSPLALEAMEPQRWTPCGFIPILRRRSCSAASG